MSLAASVITIDGPSGSGKGTVSALVAARLGWHWLDSGAIYRVLALTLIRKNIYPGDLNLLLAEAMNLRIEFVQESSKQKVFLDDEDVTVVIRGENCGNVASAVAAIPEVRNLLVDYQRRQRREPGLVADGRDMGTIIFPDANLKIFLTADLQERAKRRQLQLKAMDIEKTFKVILADLVARDERDSNRSIAPLEKAKDAVVINTTTLTVEQVVDRIGLFYEDSKK